MWLLATMLSVFGCFASIEQPEGKPYQSTKGWILTGEQAKTWYNKDALFVDTRPLTTYQKQHITGAVHTVWQTFSQTQPASRGNLLQDIGLLNEKLKALGVQKNKAVVVYGNPAQGWGEEGRIAWMLRIFGHSQTFIVDGGYLALVQQGIPTTQTIPQPRPGNFEVDPAYLHSPYLIQRDQFQRLVQQPPISPGSWLAIDTREEREYKGETPYGETRGGHVPGAIHLHFQSLLNTLGYLRSRDEILQRLQLKGATPQTLVVLYCTGGIRSGWMTFVLLDLGFSQVKNYAGSMWEWSAAPASSFPLSKDP